jgi:magnesium-transporting ATPase (P-type)
VLLARCTAERVAGAVRPLTDARRRQVLADVDRLAGLALRTLAVAYRPLPRDAEARPDPAAERELIYLGMVGIVDPPRAEARAAIAEARQAGIRVLMITGDHPRTAVRIAGDLGIVAPDARVVTGAELERLDDAALRAAVREAAVYARVAPEHKLRIVDALQAEGRIVAMTGDGVNDAPALKAADIGVAMGVTGTDVTKEAADMILADDDFSTIVAAVREGRGIFANIRTFLRFLLSSNVGEVATMLAGVLLAGALGLDDAGDAVAVPLLATQILWINLLTDSAPALALGLDPPPADVMRRPPRRLTDRVIDPGMWLGIAWIGAVMAAVTLIALDLRLAGGLIGGAGELDQARTAAFTTLVLAQVFNALNARSSRASARRGERRAVGRGAPQARGPTAAAPLLIARAHRPRVRRRERFPTPARCRTPRPGAWTDVSGRPSPGTAGRRRSARAGRREPAASRAGRRGRRARARRGRRPGRRAPGGRRRDGRPACRRRPPSAG